ncbi:MAG: hypothetical protein KGR26_09045, partial [Cyanobacteria bacterium REEB65]|nr:hypothetical protein [Cyanobacteria bacterium REEB65]
SPLTFGALQASIDVTEPIPTNSVPVNLPPELAQTGISPGAVSIKLTINNQSQLSGQFSPQIAGVTANGTVIPLVLHQGAVSPPQTAFDGSFAPATTTGATQSTTITIDQTNSNILGLLSGGATTLEVGGGVRVFGNHVAITSQDAVGARADIAIPLSLVFAPFGPGQAHPAYDVQPASPLAISSSVQGQIQQYLQSAELDVRVDNGWKFPFVLTLLFSSTKDPYTDSAALSRTLSLGTGPTTVSTLSLGPQDLADLPNFKTLGIALTSPGSAGQALSIATTDTLRIQVAVRIVAMAGGQLIHAVGQAVGH